MDAYQKRLDSGKVSKFYAQVGIKGFNVRSVAFKFVLNSTTRRRTDRNY